MTAFVGGNRLDLLTGGRELFPAMVAECDAARSEIRIETYIFENDESGERVAGALAAAAGRGVAVYVLADGYGSKDLDRGFVERLRRAGVAFRFYRPDIAPSPFHLHRMRRMHRKLAVIDARVAFVGGINVIDDMHTPRQKPPRFDFAVRVEGPLVADIDAAAQRLWWISGFLSTDGGDAPASTPRPAADGRGGQRAALVLRDNLRHRRDIESAYLDAIAGARSEIIIANAYFLPGRSFRHALIDGSRRGVKVVLLLQARVEYVLMHYASRALYGTFLDAGIEIHEYGRSFLHAKVAVIDGRWATVGSSNIDPMSFLLAREANVVVDDAAFADELRSILLVAMAEGAQLVQAESWRQRPLALRCAGWLSYGVARLLTGVFAYGRTSEFT